eukprot:GFUD01037683.1.p1 GENE.GFUD01037683.1~~GFUD01037683.1.p1  ORF type:complete len:460 (+),score=117.15 GFUD01037683.1:40-1419(+)
MKSQCFNCLRDDGSYTLSQCSKCKVAKYCSTVCQKEHWITTHKKHCKYLAGEAKFPGWEEHNPRTCPTCMDVMMKPEKYSKEQSEYLLCVRNSEAFRSELFSDLLGGGTGSVELPFSLGEISGTYLDIIDELLATETILLENITFRMTGEQAQAAKELGGKVQSRRVAHWIDYLRMGRCNDKDASHVIDLMKVDRLLGNNQSSGVANNVNLWQTFMLVKSIILRVEVYEKHLRQGVISEDLVWKFGTSEKQWGKVDVLLSDSGVLKIKTILKIKEKLALQSREEAECSTCYRKVELDAAHLICDSAKFMIVTTVETDEGILVHSSHSQLAVFQDKRMDEPFILVLNCGRKMFISCGGKVCKVATAIAACGDQECSSEEDRMNCICGIQCEFCHKMSQETHRCSKCRSKSYCSPECQARDWERVHSKVCRDYRKDGTHVALGSTERRERGQRMAEAAASI